MKKTLESMSQYCLNCPAGQMKNCEHTPTKKIVLSTYQLAKIRSAIDEENKKLEEIEETKEHKQ